MDGFNHLNIQKQNKKYSVHSNTIFFFNLFRDRLYRLGISNWPALAPAVLEKKLLQIFFLHHISLNQCLNVCETVKLYY